MVSDPRWFELNRNEETLTWAEEDEPLYTAALLVAGDEPLYDGNHVWASAHTEWVEWRNKVISVLMHKYHNCWWAGESHFRDPDYRRKAAEIRGRIETKEVNKFYVWLCHEKEEPWTRGIIPTSNSV